MAAPKKVLTLEYANVGESSSGKSINFSQTAADAPVGNIMRTFFVPHKELSDAANAIRGAQKVTITVSVS